MKKIYAILLISLFAVGCDSYLDRQPDEPKTSKNIFEKRETTFRYLANVYSWTNNETDNSGQANYFEPASDECACAFTGRGFRLMNNSTWQVSSAVYASNTYENYYKGIREASYFMANVARCPELTPAEVTEWIAEARFLRAYYYFCLMRQYGPVILLGESTADFTDPALRDLDRNTWDECVDYVCGELDAAASDLPLEQPAVWYGRATKGAALAVKARLLLYSARPLFNGNPMYASMKNVYGRNLFPTEYDPAKWQLAADAAKAVMDLNVYEIVGENANAPYDSWKKVFIERWNKELIFAVQRTCYNWRVSTIPRAVGGRAYGGVSVTQKLVDAFAMSNGRYPITGYLSDGKPIIDDESGYTESGFASFKHPILGQTKPTFKMYLNREPRFYMSVYWSGLNWIGGTNRLDEIQLYTGGNSGPGIDGTQTNYSVTGYLPFKFQDITLDSKSAGSSTSAWIAITWPLFRYAEILLDYANSWHDKISNLYKMIDGSSTTHWEAAYNPSKTYCDEVLGSKAAFHCPFEFIWDFGGEHPLVGVALMRRYNNTDLIAGYFEVSADKETWVKVAEFDYITDLADDRKNQGPFRYDFEEESARYMRVVITDSSNKNATRDTAAIAEIYAYEVEN